MGTYNTGSIVNSHVMVALGVSTAWGRVVESLRCSLQFMSYCVSTILKKMCVTQPGKKKRGVPQLPASHIRANLQTGVGGWVGGGLYSDELLIGWDSSRGPDPRLGGLLC